MKKLLLILILTLVSGWSVADQTKTVYNPFTGKLDYITALTTNTIIAGTGLTTSCSSGACTINSSGGSGPSGSIVASPQFRVPYYSVSGTSNVITGMSGITTTDGTDLTISSGTIGTDASGTYMTALGSDFLFTNTIGAFSDAVQLNLRNAAILRAASSSGGIANNYTSRPSLEIRDSSGNRKLYVNTEVGITPYIIIPTTGSLRFSSSNDHNYVGFRSSDTLSSNIIWVLPNADGSSGQAIVTDGSSRLSFATIANLSSTNTWTGGQTLQSSTTFTGAVVISTTVILNGSTGTNGQVFTSGGQNAVATWTTLSSAGLASTQTWTGQNNWTTPAQSTFTYGVTMGSLTISGIQLSATEGSSSNVTGVASGVDVLWGDSTSHTFRFNPNNSSTYTVVGSSTSPTTGHIATWSGTGSLIDGGTAAVGTITGVVASNGLTGGGTSGSVTVSVSSVSLSTQVVGNLPVTNLNSGTGATSSTFWRGDGTWVSSSTFGSGTASSASSGTIVQVVSSTTISAFSTTSTSFANTFLGVTITPVSTSDIILIHVSGPISNASAVASAFATISKGTVNLLGSNGQCSETGLAAGAVPCSMVFVDTGPLTTSATTYFVQAMTSNGSFATTFGATNQTQSMILEEVNPSGLSSGTINVGTIGQLGYYATTGSAISGAAGTIVTASSITNTMSGGETITYGLTVGSVTANTQLVVPIAANAIPSTKGDIRYDSTADALRTYNGITLSTVTIPQVIYTTAPVFYDILYSTNITTNLTAHTSQFTFPANFFTVGKIVQATISYQQSAAATIPTFLQGVRFQKTGPTNVSLVTGTANTPAAGVSNGTFMVQIACTATGASGSFVASMSPSGSNGFWKSNVTGSPVTADTTAAQALQFTITFGASSNNNYSQILSLVIEEMN